MYEPHFFLDHEYPLDIKELEPLDVFDIGNEHTLSPISERDIIVE